MLTESFYTRLDVVLIARQLIGKELFVNFNNHLRSGIIIETEAYNGVTDKACHAFNYRRTPRTEIMFGQGGKAYIYLCYGIHSLFNVVTGAAGNPQAVLIRGIAVRKPRHIFRVISGPGKLSKYLGIHYSQSGISLLDRKSIWIENSDYHFDPKKIRVTPRIGVESAGEDALLPYRFILEI